MMRLEHIWSLWWVFKIHSRFLKLYLRSDQLRLSLGSFALDFFRSSSRGTYQLAIRLPIDPIWDNSRMYDAFGSGNKSGLFVSLAGRVLVP